MNAVTTGCDVSREGCIAPAAVARTCQVCAAPLFPSRRARYCSRACQQRAYRLRTELDTSNVVTDLAAQLRAQQALVAQTVYECGGCGQRYLGEQRCEDCNRMCRKLGFGGQCSGCDEVMLVTELLGLAS